MAALAQAELLRYSRHLILRTLGSRVRKAEVRARPADRRRRARLARGLYLAAAGVGTLGLVDFDNVDVTNLQRQILHGTKDVGRPKLVSARGAQSPM